MPALNLARTPLPPEQETELTTEADPVAAPGPDARKALEDPGTGDQYTVLASEESGPSGGSSEALRRLMEFDSSELPEFSDSPTDDQGLEELWKLADEVGEPVINSEVDSDEDKESSLPVGWEGDLGDRLEPPVGESLPQADPPTVTTQSAEEALAALRELVRGSTQEASEQPTPESASASRPALDADPFAPNPAAEVGAAEDPGAEDWTAADWQSDLPAPRVEDSDYPLPDPAFEATADAKPAKDPPELPEDLEQAPAYGLEGLNAQLNRVAGDIEAGVEQPDPGEADLTAESQPADSPLADSMPATAEEGVDEELGRLSQSLDAIGAGPAPEDSSQNRSQILSEANQTSSDECAPDVETRDARVVQFPDPEVLPETGGEPLEEETQEAAGAASVEDSQAPGGSVSELEIQPVLALTPIVPTAFAGQAETRDLKPYSSSEPAEPSWMSTLEVWDCPTTEASDGPVVLHEAGALSAGEPLVVEAFAWELQEPRETTNELLEPAGLVILAAAEEAAEETIIEAVPL